MEFNNREEYENSKIYFTKENCPFCEKNIWTKIILFETNYWIIIKAEYPYFNDYEKHLLVIPKRHIEFTFELNEEEFKDFLNIEKFMFDFYKWMEYFSFIRQSKSNKSVEHLHYHYLLWIPAQRTIDWEKYLKIKD